MSFTDFDKQHMLRAIQLAAKGQGLVEPNPMVGCVIARDTHVLGEGFHQAFGEAHAEVNAISEAQERRHDVVGATAYVTLEPCCHSGKTPPCTRALTDAGLGRVVIAGRDPFPKVAGGGIAALESAGIEVQEGLQAEMAIELNRPYLRLVEDGRPWIMAKWAMTLDGKIATHTGDSQWISGELSRQRVHQLRGRVDAILIGRQTAVADDPLLTARPPGPRVATRIVLDSAARLALDSQLVRTAADVPAIVVTGPDADADHCQALEAAGCEVLRSKESDSGERLVQLLSELGSRRMTNVLVEGGSALLGSLFDQQLVDEVHVFIAPRIIGGADATTAVGGRGADLVAQSRAIKDASVTQLGDDVYLHGRLQHVG